MPADATKTLEDILQSAKTEFLAHGFAGASLRTIATGANVTTGALYRHFKDKDALFEAVVAPAYNGFLAQYEAMCTAYFRQLEEQGIGAMWQNTSNQMEALVEAIYDAYDVFKLLITGSEQTPYEYFLHSLVDMSADVTARYIEMAQKLGYPVKTLGQKELHILTSAQYTCVFEMVLHDTPREEAIALTSRLFYFFEAGWQALMMEPPQ